MISWLIPVVLAASPFDALKAHPPDGCSMSKNDPEPSRNAAVALAEMKRGAPPMVSLSMNCNGKPAAAFAWKFESASAAQTQLARLSELMWSGMFPPTPPFELLLFKGEWAVLLSGAMSPLSMQLTTGGFLFHGEPAEDISEEQLASVKSKIDCKKSKWACDAIEAFKKGTALAPQSALVCRLGAGLGLHPDGENSDDLVYVCTTAAQVGAGPLNSVPGRASEQAALVEGLKAGKRPPPTHPLFELFKEMPPGATGRRQVGVSTVPRGVTLAFVRQTRIGVVEVLVRGGGGMRAVAVFP